MLDRRDRHATSPILDNRSSVIRVSRPCSSGSTSRALRWFSMRRMLPARPLSCPVALATDSTAGYQFAGVGPAGVGEHPVDRHDRGDQQGGRHHARTRLLDRGEDRQPGDPDRDHGPADDPALPPPRLIGHPRRIPATHGSHAAPRPPPAGGPRRSRARRTGLAVQRLQPGDGVGVRRDRLQQPERELRRRLPRLARGIDPLGLLLEAVPTGHDGVPRLDRPGEARTARPRPPASPRPAARDRPGRRSRRIPGGSVSVRGVRSAR